MKKTKMFLLLIAMLFAVAFTACGGGGGGEMEEVQRHQGHQQASGTAQDGTMAVHGGRRKTVSK